MRRNRARPRYSTVLLLWLNSNSFHILLKLATQDFRAKYTLQRCCCFGCLCFHNSRIVRWIPPKRKRSIKSLQALLTIAEAYSIPIWEPKSNDTHIQTDMNAECKRMRLKGIRQSKEEKRYKVRSERRLKERWEKLKKFTNSDDCTSFTRWVE